MTTAEILLRLASTAAQLERLAIVVRLDARLLVVERKAETT